MHSQGKWAILWSFSGSAESKWWQPDITDFLSLWLDSLCWAKKIKPGSDPSGLLAILIIFGQETAPSYLLSLNYTTYLNYSRTFPLQNKRSLAKIFTCLCGVLSDLGISRKMHWGFFHTFVLFYFPSAALIPISTLRQFLFYFYEIGIINAKAGWMCVHTSKRIQL